MFTKATLFGKAQHSLSQSKLPDFWKERKSTHDGPLWSTKIGNSGLQIGSRPQPEAKQIVLQKVAPTPSRVSGPNPGSKPKPKSEKRPKPAPPLKTTNSRPADGMKGSKSARKTPVESKIFSLITDGSNMRRFFTSATKNRDGHKLALKDFEMTKDFKQQPFPTSELSQKMAELIGPGFEAFQRQLEDTVLPEISKRFRHCFDLIDDVKEGQGLENDPEAGTRDADLDDILSTFEMTLTAILEEEREMNDLFLSMAIEAQSQLEGSIDEMSKDLEDWNAKAEQHLQQLNKASELKAHSRSAATAPPEPTRRRRLLDFTFDKEDSGFDSFLDIDIFHDDDGDVSASPKPVLLRVPQVHEYDDSAVSPEPVRKRLNFSRYDFCSNKTTVTPDDSCQTYKATFTSLEDTIIGLFDSDDDMF